MAILAVSAGIRNYRRIRDADPPIMKCNVLIDIGFWWVSSDFWTQKATIHYHQISSFPVGSAIGDRNRAKSIQDSYFPKTIIPLSENISLWFGRIPPESDRNNANKKFLDQKLPAIRCALAGPGGIANCNFNHPQKMPELF